MRQVPLLRPNTRRMSSTKRYWMDLGDLHQDPAAIKGRDSEFRQDLAIDQVMGDASFTGASTGRRDFLKFLGFGLGAATLGIQIQATVVGNLDTNRTEMSALVDASQGLSRQTRRHSLILSMLGIRQVILAIFPAICADAEFQVGIVVLRLATDLALMDGSRTVHDRAAEILPPAQGNAPAISARCSKSSWK